jgi:hypothetical protein
MTNIQLLFSIGIPSLLVLVNIAIGTWAIKDLRAEMHGNNDSLRTEIKDVRTEIKDVRAEIKDLRAEMIVRLDRVDADLRTFYAITGKHEGRLDALEKR